MAPTTNQPAATTPAEPVSASNAQQPHVAAPDLNPSFIKGVFVGEFDETLVFPFPLLEDDERDSLRMILGTFRAFAEEHIDAAKHDHDGRFDPAVLAGLHSLGFMGVNIPEAYGGFGASTKIFARVFGELGATDPALAVYFGAHQSIGCKGIILFGTEAQKQRYLPRCATGELVAAFCLTEPGSGSDAQAMATTATPSDDGSFYTLNGAKMWISNAGYAGVFTVFAKIPSETSTHKPRITAFIVDADTPGIRLGKIEEKMGIKASDTRPVFFENVRVPAENVLGEVGHGFRIALEILNSGRLGLAAASMQAARHIMREAIAYARTREQFGKPIASFEMLREKIAVAAADCYASEAATRLTAGMVDRGGIDYSLETAACKIFASELAYRTANDALQMAGGIGYSKEFPYERAVRDARINLIFEGTNEILRMLISLSGIQHPAGKLSELKHALQNPLHSIGDISAYAVERVSRSLHHPGIERVDPSFQDEARGVRALVHMLATHVEASLRRHGRAITDREIVQERMANAAIDIYHSTAVLSRVTATIAAGIDPAVVEAEKMCARLFLRTAYERTEQQIRAIVDDEDDALAPVVNRAVETLDVAPSLLDE